MSAKPNKLPVAGVMVDTVTPSQACDRVIAAAEAGQALSVSALAVHGVMTGVDDPEHLYRLNHLGMVTPDGQPVRWALNWLHDTKLQERVYGPTLMLDVCREAEQKRFPIFLFGSSANVVQDLVAGLLKEFPDLQIAGSEPSQFRTGTDEEADALAARIRESGARICFVGLGCPRQEVFIYEMAPRCSMPMLAVGAAFDFHAGHQKEPPKWIQDHGFQWAQRLAAEPRRLAHRYLVLGPRYIGRIAGQRLGRRGRAVDSSMPVRNINYL